MEIPKVHPLTAQWVRPYIWQSLTSEWDETVNMSAGRKGYDETSIQYFKENVNRRNSFVTYEVKQIKFVFFSKQNSNISREIWVPRFSGYGDCHVQEYDAQWFGRNFWLWEVTDASSFEGRMWEKRKSFQRKLYTNLPQGKFTSTHVSE